MKLNQKIFNSPRLPKTKLGNAGYDNARENIDPHVKTKVVNTKELIYDGNYANIHVDDSNASAQTIPTGASYTKVTGFADNGLNSKSVPDATNNKIIFGTPGTYLVSHNSSFTGNTNNVTYYVAAFLDNVEQNNLHFVRKLGTAGDVGSASFCGIINVPTANMELDIRIRQDNLLDVEYTMQYANLTINYIGK